MKSFTPFFLPLPIHPSSPPVNKKYGEQGAYKVQVSNCFLLSQKFFQKEITSLSRRISIFPLPGGMPPQNSTTERGNSF